MASEFLKLPDECISMIFSFLCPSQVRRAALMFNRRLLAIAKPFLDPLNEYSKDEAYFEALFGKIEPDRPSGNIMTKSAVEKLNERLKFTDQPISVPLRPSHHLEYLSLKDDLAWFEPVAEEDDIIVEGVSKFDEHIMNLEKLIKATARLGLKLPSSFVKFLRSEKLIERLPSGECWFVELDGELRKIRKPLKNDASRSEEGYVFTWYWEARDHYHTHMYLDTSGRHAILGSERYIAEMEGVEEEPPDLTDIEKGAGIVELQFDSVEDLVLEDVNFERWLVNHYYATRLPWHLGKSSIPDHMRKYLCNVYTEWGRMMQ